MSYTHHNKISSVNGYALGEKDKEIDIVNSDGTFQEKYRDLSYPSTQTKIGANSKPDFDFTNIGLLFPQNDNTEISYYSIILNHDWKAGTRIYPHVHWRQSANQTPVFKIDYKWYNLGEIPPANFTTYTMNEKIFEYTSGTLAQVTTNKNGIDGTGKHKASTMIVKLYRDDNAYTGDVLVDQFDIHIQVDSFGTLEQFK